LALTYDSLWTIKVFKGDSNLASFRKRLRSTTSRSDRVVESEGEKTIRRETQPSPTKFYAQEGEGQRRENRRSFVQDMGGERKTHQQSGGKNEMTRRDLVDGLFHEKNRGGQQKDRFAKLREGFSTKISQKKFGWEYARIEKAVTSSRRWGRSTEEKLEKKRDEVIVFD